MVGSGAMSQSYCAIRKRLLLVAPRKKGVYSSYYTFRHTVYRAAGLRGWQDHTNTTTEYRTGEGHVEALPAVSREPTTSGLDLIVAVGTRSAMAREEGEPNHSRRQRSHRGPFADGRCERCPALAAELIKLNVDVIRCERDARYEMNAPPPDA
jgi:hypothetical protein